MRRVIAFALVVAPAVASAEPTQIGAWFGPRIYSDDSFLGYLDNAPAHPTLHNGIELGLRVSREFFPFRWLVPEFEVGVSPTSTTEAGGAMSASVVWVEPRFQFRFELLPGRRVQPFLFIGGGAPISLSSARKTFNTSVIGDGYAGGGLRVDTQKGFGFRIDARLSVVPGVERIVTTEVEVGFGIDLFFGGKKAPPVEETTTVLVPLADKDEDGIPDKDDKCPDRPEDNDNFEDGDGCPDIDNDGDRVLDIADKCGETAETYNGYQDDDGCADSVPPEVDALVGTIEGLFYAEGETGVRDSAQKTIDRLAKQLVAQPSVKVVLVGHTDDREAKAFVTPDGGQDIETIAVQIARGRAEAVRQALEAAGVPNGKIVVDGVGAEEPVADNTTAKGRLANRRVELRLFVPRQ